MENLTLTESQVANEWIAKGALKQRRDLVIRLLNRRFPRAIPADVTRLILEQESFDLLLHWFDTAASANTFDEFMAVLKQ